MYKVYNRESENFPKETFTVWYDVDFDGDNSEWRVCVDDIIKRYSASHEIKSVDIPDFEEFEDFVELKYTINNNPLNFSCDFLLYSIFVTTSSIELTEKLREELAAQVGWWEAE